MHLDERLGNGARCLAGQRLHGAAVLLGLAAMGCSDNPETVRLDVYTWWDQAEEKVAFDAVARMHMDRYENVEVRTVDAPSDEARQEMSMRMLAEAPPPTFQANIGADLLRWAVFDTESDPNGNATDPPDSSRSLLSPLDRLFAETGLAVPQELTTQLRVETGTGPFAVPLNIHRENILYYNKEKLRDYEISTGKNLLLLETLCPPDAADPSAPALGENVVALAFDDPWPLVLLVFENILPALVAADPDEDQEYYTKLLKGERPEAVQGIPSEKVDQALACAQYLSRSAHGDSSRWTWDETVRAVGNGAAIFTVMGDWANALLEYELANDLVGAVPFPGTQHVYVYTSDTFPLPIGVDHPAETRELLKTFASEEGQVRFSEEKGSIPARLGVSFVSPTASSEEFTNPTIQKLLATSGYFPPYFPSDSLAGAIRTMMTGDDPMLRTDALRVFTDLEPILTHWQHRLSQGLVPPPRP